jgi:predicted transposase YdaD
MIHLVEELLLARFPQFNREEVCMQFKLHDIRESKVWQVAHEGGAEEGDVRRPRETINTLVGKGMTFERISALLDISVDEIRRVADNH